MRTLRKSGHQCVFELVAGAAVPLACVALACQAADPANGSSNALFEAGGNAPSDLFGGETEAAVPSAPASPCDVAHPSPENPRIDDFEDGDAQIHRVFERDGWWWVGSDDTAGSMTPTRGAVQPEVLAEGGRAMHFTAEGFTEWGAQLGVSLEWSSEGIKCPFNAGAYDGFSFRAKGTGSLPVQVTLPQTNGAGSGDPRSKCTEGCWDHYQVVRQLTEDWVRHEVRWADLQQGGWGKPVPFDAEQLIGIVFSPKPEDLPVDAWIDDLEFIAR